EGIEPLLKPLVAEIRSTPLPFELRPLTYVSTPGLDVAVMPTTAKESTVVLVPCLRKPMPLVPPLPALVLFWISTTTVVFSPVVLLPESTRMPGRTPASGAATLLLVIVALSVPFDDLAVARMPLPWVFLIVLPSTVTVRTGASVTAKC